MRDYLQTRGMLHPVDETSEMAISKLVAPLISQKAYSRKARDVMQKYNLDAGTAGIVHAVTSQRLSSRFPYLEDYFLNVRGKSPADVAISFPETKQARKAGDLASRNVYKAAAEASRPTDYKLPVELPENELAKRNAKLISDVRPRFVSWLSKPLLHRFL